MHVIQTITAIHDRYITGPAASHSTLEEVFHLSQAAALFNQKLSGIIHPHDRDALWATAGLLSQIAFAFVDASTPEEAWPLRGGEDPTDLEWIAMSENKMAIWEIASPMRPESIFHGLAMDLVRLDRLCGISEPNIANLPRLFAKVFDLENDSIAETCPYRSSVLLLSSLMPLECNRDTLVKFLGFASHMNPKYKLLLTRKDSKALLILAYWYAKVLNSVWWLDRRATMECQAIILYLERYYPNEEDILELLKFPKECCGMWRQDLGILRHCSM
jgi:hypothetical protein